jgi:hypothetical protein
MLYLIQRRHNLHNQAKEKGFLFSEFSLILFFQFFNKKIIKISKNATISFQRGSNRVKSKKNFIGQGHP